MGATIDAIQSSLHICSIIKNFSCSQFLLNSGTLPKFAEILGAKLNTLETELVAVPIVIWYSVYV